MLTVPHSQNPWIADLLDGLQRRSRALKHKTRSVECEQVFEEVGGIRTEIIELFIDRKLVRQRVVLCASIWDSRWAWVNVRGTAKSGWVEWSVEGRAVEDLTGRSLWATIEQTYDEGRLLEFTETVDWQALEKMWGKILLRGSNTI